MEVRSDRAVSGVAWALLAAVALLWLVGWWVPSPGIECDGAGPQLPDCGVVVRDRP